MKKLFAAVMLTCGLVLGAENPPTQPAPVIHVSDLPVFDLDFKGGSPRDLVKALNEPLAGTLNVVIPDEANNNVRIPAIKLKHVNVQQVFNALQSASEQMVPYQVSGGIQYASQSYQFTTLGPANANSVWAFRSNGMTASPPPAPPSWKFYQLGPYLEKMKIDDIITALQTGWKMVGTGSGPDLKFHPETKLLIAVGNKSDFAMIDDALKEMDKMPRPKEDIFLSGAVRMPGRFSFPADRNLSVAQAIELGGGFTSGAETNQVRLVRSGFADRVKMDGAGQLLLVEPGDHILVDGKK